jgi:hypothetical protein
MKLGARKTGVEASPRAESSMRAQAGPVRRPEATPACSGSLAAAGVRGLTDGCEAGKDAGEAGGAGGVVGAGLAGAVDALSGGVALGAEVAVGAGALLGAAVGPGIEVALGAVRSMPNWGGKRETTMNSAAKRRRFSQSRSGSVYVRSRTPPSVLTRTRYLSPKSTIST